MKMAGATTTPTTTTMGENIIMWIKEDEVMLSTDSGRIPIRHLRAIRQTGRDRRRGEPRRAGRAPRRVARATLLVRQGAEQEQEQEQAATARSHGGKAPAGSVSMVMVGPKTGGIRPRRLLLLPAISIEVWINSAPNNVAAGVAVAVDLAATSTDWIN